MIEDAGFPLGRVLAYFSWIFGLAVILATLSYYEYLTHERKITWKEIISKPSFIKLVHIGGILIMGGISGSLRLPFLAGLFGVAAFLLALWYASLDRVWTRLKKRRLRKKLFK